MKTTLKIKLFLCFLLCIFTLQGWCFFVHKKINHYAVYTFAKNKDAKMLFDFFQNNIDYIVEHAGDPDKRRIYMFNEAQKHFLNIEAFGKKILEQDYVSFDEFKNYYAFELAKKLYPECKNQKELEKKVKKILKTYGTNPWSIIQEFKNLTEDFKHKDIDKILKTTISLAHYIGDSCVPFHVTENYDGQLTKQDGIHKFWETTLPTYFFEEYDINEDNVPTAEYCKNVNVRVWKNILHSNKESIKALDVEKQLDDDVVLGKFCYKTNGKNVDRMHAKEYAREYHNRLEGQEKQQIKISIKMVGDLIYTAWVNAGKPDINADVNKVNAGKPDVNADIKAKKPDVNVKKQDVNVKKQDVNVKKQDINVKKQDVNVKKQDVNVKNERLFRRIFRSVSNFFKKVWRNNNKNKNKQGWNNKNKNKQGGNNKNKNKQGGNNKNKIKIIKV